MCVYITPGTCCIVHGSLYISVICCWFNLLALFLVVYKAGIRKILHLQWDLSKADITIKIALHKSDISVKPMVSAALREIPLCNFPL